MPISYGRTSGLPSESAQAGSWLVVFDLGHFPRYHGEMDTGMELLLLVGITFGVVLLGVLAMVFGVMKSGKPIQHCGGAAIGPNGEKIQCKLCGGDPDDCETKRESEAANA